MSNQKIKHLSEIIFNANELLSSLVTEMQRHEQNANEAEKNSDLFHVEQNVPCFLKKDNDLQWVKFENAMPADEGTYVVIINSVFGKAKFLWGLKNILTSNEKSRLIAWLKIPEFEE